MSADESEPTAHSPQPWQSMSRRRMLQVAAASGATAAGLTGGLPDRLDPVDDAEAVAPLVAYGGAIAAGAIAGYIVGAPNQEPTDQQEYDQAHKYDQWVQIYTDAQAMIQEDETVLTSLKNEIGHAEDKAREEAVFRIYEQASYENGTSSAQTAAEDAIDEQMAIPEKNLLTWWEARFKLIANAITTGDGDETIFDPPGVEFGKDYDPRTESVGALLHTNYTTTYDYTLRNGETHTISAYDTNGEFTNSETLINPDPTASAYQRYQDDWDGSAWTDKDLYTGFAVQPPDTSHFSDLDSSDYDHSFSELSIPFTTPQYAEIIEDINSRADSLKSEAQTLVDQFYQPIADGEVTLSDLTGPAALAEKAQNADHFGEAELLFRSQGIPMATEVANVEVHAEAVSVEDGTNDNTTDGNTTDDNTSDGNTTDDNTTDGNTTDGNTSIGTSTTGSEDVYEGRLAWSLGDGKTLPVGEEIDPSAHPGSIQFAYNYYDTNGDLAADVVELTASFTITATEDGSDELLFEDRDMVQSDTDPEEARTIYEENRQAEQDAEEVRVEVVTDSGGGGPMFPDLDTSDVPGGWLGGAAIIGGTVTAVSAFVSKVLP